MSTRFLRHALIGACNGQEVVNVLWYYTPVTSMSPLTAAMFFADQWSTDLLAVYTRCLPTVYTLQRTETSCFSSEWVAELSSPWQMSIGVAGQQGGSLMGQSPYVVVNFTLDYSYGEVPFRHGPVKRSYIAYGPLVETAVDNSHVFIPTVYPVGAVADLLQGLVAEIKYGTGPDDGVAIRVGSPTFKDNGGPDPLGYRSWAKALTAITRNVTSDRASRIPR